MMISIKKSMRMVLVILVATAACMFWCIGLTQSYAESEIGLGIEPGTIRVGDPVARGGDYTLPSITVHNLGDSTKLFTVSLAAASQYEMVPSDDFVKLNPRQFSLAPLESQEVTIELLIPEDAIPGNYLAHVEAKTQPEGHNEGAVVGIAAATKVHFTVSGTIDPVEQEGVSFQMIAGLSAAAIAVLATIIGFIIVRYRTNRVKQELSE
jgi:hypothetical protein